MSQARINVTANKEDEAKCLIDASNANQTSSIFLNKNGPLVPILSFLNLREKTKVKATCKLFNSKGSDLIDKDMTIKFPKIVERMSNCFHKARHSSEFCLEANTAFEAGAKLLNTLLTQQIGHNQKLFSFTEISVGTMLYVLNIEDSKYARYKDVGKRYPYNIHFANITTGMPQTTFEDCIQSLGKCYLEGSIPFTLDILAKPLRWTPNSKKTYQVLPLDIIDTLSEFIIAQNHPAPAAAAMGPR